MVFRQLAVAARKFRRIPFHLTTLLLDSRSSKTLIEALGSRRYCCDLTPAGLLAQQMEKKERHHRLRLWLFKTVATKQESGGRERAGSGDLLN
ncbi:hypothetical protein LXL04_007312 [Taraxacum kok-saghyz]